MDSRAIRKQKLRSLATDGNVASLNGIINNEFSNKQMQIINEQNELSKSTLVPAKESYDNSFLK